jgi:hypothetical protein
MWLAFTRDLRRERTFTTRDVATVHDIYGTSMQSITSARASVPRPASPPPESPSPGSAPQAPPVQAPDR